MDASDIDYATESIQRVWRGFLGRKKGARMQLNKERDKIRSKQNRKVGHISQDKGQAISTHLSDQSHHAKDKLSQPTHSENFDEYAQNDVQVYKAVKRAGKIGSYDGKVGKPANSNFGHANDDWQNETECDDHQSHSSASTGRRAAPTAPAFILVDPLIQSHLSAIQEEDDVVRDSLASTTASNMARNRLLSIGNKSNNNSASNSPKTFNKKSLAKNTASVGASYVADSLEGDAFRNVARLEKQGSTRTNSTSRSGNDNDVDAEAEDVPTTARSRAATSEADSIEYGQFVKTDRYDAFMANMADDYNAWDDMDPYAEENDTTIMEDSLQRSKKFNFAQAGNAGLQGKPPRSPRRNDIRDDGNDMEHYSQYNVIPPDYSKQGQPTQPGNDSQPHSGIPRFTSRKSTPFLKAFDSDGSLSKRVDNYGEPTSDLNSPPRGAEKHEHFSPGKPYVPSVRDLLAASPESPRIRSRGEDQQGQRLGFGVADVPKLRFPREEPAVAPPSMLSKLEQAQLMYANNVRRNFPRAPPPLQMQFPGLQKDGSMSPSPLSSRSNSTVERSPRAPPGTQAVAPQHNPVAQSGLPARVTPQPLALPIQQQAAPLQAQHQQPPQGQAQAQAQAQAQGYAQQAMQRQQLAAQEQQQITPRSIRVTHPQAGPPPMPAQLQAQQQAQQLAPPQQRRPQPLLQPSTQQQQPAPTFQQPAPQHAPSQLAPPSQRVPKQDAAPSGGYFAEYNASRAVPGPAQGQVGAPPLSQVAAPGRFSSLPSKLIPPAAAAKVSLNPVNPVVKPIGQKNSRRDGNMSQTKLTELQEQKLLEEIEELNRIQLQKLQELAQAEEADKAAKAISPKNGAKKAAKEPDAVKEKEKRAFKAGAKDVNPTPILAKLKAKVAPPVAAAKAPAVEEWNEAAQRDQSNKARGKGGLSLAPPGAIAGNGNGGGYAAAPSPIANIHQHLAGPNQPLPVELGEVAGGFGAGAGYLQVYKKKQEVVRNPSNPRGRRGAGDGQDGQSANGDAQSEGRLFQNRRREGEMQQAKYAPAYEETSSLPAIPSARNAKSSGSTRANAIRQAGQGEGAYYGNGYAGDAQNPPFVHPLDGQNRRVLNSSRNNTMSAPSRLHDQPADDEDHYSGNNGYGNGYGNGYANNGYGQGVPQNMRGQSDKSALPEPVKVSHDYAAMGQQAVPIYNMQKKMSSKATAGGGGGGYSNKR